MVHLYVTDYGEVRVSERELRTLRLADDIRAAGRKSELAVRVQAMAAAIENACVRFAKWRHDHG